MGKSRIAHRDLCRVGKEYLLRTKKCNPVFCEQGTSVSPEMPDVIGWTRTGSILIECKATRADFLADRKKAHRHAEKSLGSVRFYLCSSDKVITPGDLPEGWGLLYLDPCGHARQIISGEPRPEVEVDVRAELGFLRSRILEAQRFGR